MTYRRPLLNKSDLDLDDRVFYYSWSCGSSRRSAWDLATLVNVLVTYSHVKAEDIWSVVNDKLDLKGGKRTPKQRRRYVIRNRRAYNHDQALVRRHETATLLARDGLRCHGCKHIPPQLGEVMEPDWKAGLFEEEESNA